MPEETANNDVLYSDVTDIQVSDIKTTDIEKNNPYKGVECSGHGVCAVINDEKAVCICNDGYVNQGLDCIPDSNLCQPYCEPGKYCDKTTKTCKPLPIEVITLDDNGLTANANSIKVNSKGDVFVGGMFVQPKSLGQIYFESMVAFLYKLDSGNNIKFKKTWDIPKKIDMVTSISIDSLDNVYTTGYTDVTYTNGGGSIEIIKWKSDGSRDITFNTGETIEGTYYTPVPVDSTAVISGGTPYLYTVSSVRAREFVSVF